MTESGARRPRSPRFRRRPIGRLGPLVVVAIAVGWAGVPAGALADGEDRRIVVEPPTARPGDELSIHGEFLWTDDTVGASIVGRAGAARSIGSATTLGSGALEMRARVPDDMPSGIYEVVVTSSTGESVAVELVIEPALPILPLLAVGGSLGAVAFVVLAASRRRSGSGRVAAD